MRMTPEEFAEARQVADYYRITVPQLLRQLATAEFRKLHRAAYIERKEAS